CRGPCAHGVRLGRGTLRRRRLPSPATPDVRMTPTRPRTVVDWQQVRRRLAATERALLREDDSDPEQRRQVLQARAQAMAAARPPASVAGEGIEVVEFTLAERHCAIECAFVREVQPLKE